MVGEEEEEEEEELLFGVGGWLGGLDKETRRGRRQDQSTHLPL